MTVADQFSITEQPSTLDILLNDSDVDDQKSDLTIVVQTQPNHGLLTVNLGNVSYQAEPDFVGEDSFSYRLRDPSNASSNISNVNLQITQLDLPVAKKDIFVFNENSLDQVLDLTKNDTYTGEVRNIVIQQQPTNGVITVNSNNVTFSAFENIFGQSDFQYSLIDETGLQSAAVVSHIYLVNKNDPPIATDDVLSVVSDANNKLNILINDAGEKLQDSQINIVTSSQYGDLTTNGSDVYYRVNNIAQTQDSFSYSITDSQGLVSNIANVTLQIVDDLPVPNVTDDEFKIKINSQKQLNILSNDQFFTDDITIEITQSPASGLLVNNGKDVIYNAGAVVGEDQFSYRIQQQRDNEKVFSENAQVVLKTVIKAPLLLTDDYARVIESDLIRVNLTNNDKFEDIKLLTVFAHVVDGGARFELSSDGSSTINTNDGEENEASENKLNELKENLKIIHNNLNGSESDYQIELKLLANSNIQDNKRTEYLVYAIEDTHGNLQMAQVTITVLPSQEPDPVDIPEQPEIPELIEPPTIENVEVVAIGSDAKSGGVISYVFMLFIIVFVTYSRLAKNKNRVKSEII